MIAKENSKYLIEKKSKNNTGKRLANKDVSDRTEGMKKYSDRTICPKC